MANRSTGVIRGGCLCGGVRFEIDRVTGPFELCHCSRCRKVSGSAFMAAVAVRTADFRFVSGEELIRRYDAPILESPPAYRVSFCERCGSVVPDPPPGAKWFEIAAGSLDDDPGIEPDKHIFVDYKSAWYPIADTLPQFTKAQLIEHRRRTS